MPKKQNNAEDLYAAEKEREEAHTRELMLSAIPDILPIDDGLFRQGDRILVKEDLDRILFFLKDLKEGQESYRKIETIKDDDQNDPEEKKKKEKLKLDSTALMYHLIEKYSDLPNRYRRFITTPGLADYYISQGRTNELKALDHLMFHFESIQLSKQTVERIMNIRDLMKEYGVITSDLREHELLTDRLKKITDSTGADPEKQAMVQKMQELKEKLLKNAEVISGQSAADSLEKFEADISKQMLYYKVQLKNNLKTAGTRNKGYNHLLKLITAYDPKQSVAGKIASLSRIVEQARKVYIETDHIREERKDPANEFQYKFSRSIHNYAKEAAEDLELQSNLGKSLDAYRLKLIQQIKALTEPEKKLPEKSVPEKTAPKKTVEHSLPVIDNQ